VTCAGGSIALWDVNGDLIAEKRISESPYDTITAVTRAKVPDSVDDPVIITGHYDVSFSFFFSFFVSFSEHVSEPFWCLLGCYSLLASRIPVSEG
jgi:hypothetical protein